MIVKIHKSYRDVVAICDKELLGQVFEEEKMQLDLSGEFFNGEETSEEDVLELMKDLATEDVSFNLVGKRTCECALKIGIISKKGIKKVQGIPFALGLL